MVCAFGEEDEGDVREGEGGETGAEGGGDAGEVRVGEFVEVVWGEIACV